MSDEKLDVAPLSVVPAPCLGRYQLAVTKRRTMAYAAGIGECDERYLDDGGSTNVVAPLPFLVSVEWPVFTAGDYLRAIGRNEENQYNRFVHGFQDSVFHQPIEPGLRLDVQGEIVAARETRAGTLVVCRVLTRDLERGVLIGESWFGSMYIDTPLLTPPFEEGQQSSLLEQSDWGGSAAHGTSAIGTRTIDAHIYTECSRIWNPVHTEKAYAKSLGLRDIILHGTCTWAKTLQLLARVTGAEDGRHPFRRFGARFSGMVTPGDELEVAYRYEGNGILRFVVHDRDGRPVLRQGVAECA